jgi:hypothetical protein
MKPRFVAQCTECTERVQKRQPDSSQWSSVSMCLGGSSNATHVAATALNTPTHQPSTGLGRGRSPDVWGSADPCRGPTVKGATPTPIPTAFKFFTLPRIQSSHSYLFFYCIMIEIVLPPLSYRRLTPSEQMGDLFSIIYISVLTETICNADSRPVIRLHEGSHRKTLLIFHPYLNGFLVFPYCIRTSKYTRSFIRHRKCIMLCVRIALQLVCITNGY